MEFELETFLFDTPIYSRVEIETKNDDFFALFYSHKNPDIEGYNPWKKVQSTFRITKTLNSSYSEFIDKGGFSSLSIECKRYHSEFRFYIFWSPDEKFIIKIGQFPTVADFHLSEIKKYNKVLPEENLKEITRAIGLAANGVGIGSFVYLRRVFEHLIFEAKSTAEKENSITEEAFQRARMDEKIELLKNYLPDFLVENKSLYSILSLGVHELDEKTCLEHFDTLRVGIEIILDEQLDLVKKQQKIEAAKKKLTQLKGEIKK